MRGWRVVAMAAATVGGLAYGAAAAAGCSSYAATDASDADASDAATDAGQGEADAPQDAGADADTRRFCERQLPAPEFCRDFDDGAPALFQFDSHDVADGGAIELDAVDFQSPPAALRLSLSAGPIPDQGPDDAIVDFVGRELASTPSTKLHFGFAVRAENLSDALSARVAGIEVLDATDRPHSLFFQTKADGTTALVDQLFPAGGGDAIDTRTHTLGLPLPIGAWSRVELRVTLGADASASVTIDGFDAGPGPIALLPIEGAKKPSFALLAIYYGDAGDLIPATVVRFDDVVFDTK